MDADRVELSVARKIIEEFAALIRPHCDRLEIAGSIRRNSDYVKDGELVAIGHGADLHAALDRLASDSTVTKARYGADQSTRWGPDYRGLMYHGLKIEIFMTDLDNWGYLYWLRTGPGDANTAIMSMLGSQKAAIRFQGGQGWYSPKWEYNQKRKAWQAEIKWPLRLGSEEALFAVLGLPYLPPEYRTAVKYRTLMQAKSHKWPDYGRFIIFPTPHPYQWDNGTGRYESAKDRHGDLYRAAKEVKPCDWAIGKAYTNHTDWYYDWIKNTLRVKGGTLSMTWSQHARFKYTNYLKGIEGKTDDRSVMERKVMVELLAEVDEAEKLKQAG